MLLRRLFHMSSTKMSQSLDTNTFLDGVRQFVREEIVPNASKFDASEEFPWSIIRKAHALGFTNVDAPKELGGQGMNLQMKTRVYQELAYGCSTIAASLMISELAQIPILNSGSDFLKQKYIVQMLKEPLLAGYATTEENAGSDLANAKMDAIEHGDYFVLNGTKAYVSNGALSSWFFVLARTSATESTGKAFTGFIVDKDLDGIILSDRVPMMGQKCGDVRTLIFKDVRVPRENVVDSVGKGFSIAMQTFDRIRPVVASLGCGVQKRILDEATKYSLKRETFGKSIIQHQSVGNKLANIAQRFEASKLLVQQAAEKVDCKDPNASYFSSIAKCFCTDSALQSATEAIQVFGANGYSSEFPVEKLLRDATALQFMSGTNDIQRTIITRQLSRQYSKL
ncbi:putative medium-chain specific acyl-CoA dehydrogenase 10, mitochondrial [Aphelenchoides bicaudatus]|nr:putative medium-chain specific acyl-CoA dehydrogenase 10, mitochondrial [Aphelenchoides bicaudatus]